MVLLLSSNDEYAGSRSCFCNAYLHTVTTYNSLGYRAVTELVTSNESIWIAASPHRFLSTWEPFEVQQKLKWSRAQFANESRTAWSFAALVYWH